MRMFWQKRVAAEKAEEPAAEKPSSQVAQLNASQSGYTQIILRLARDYEPSLRNIGDLNSELKPALESVREANIPWANIDTIERRVTQLAMAQEVGERLTALLDKVDTTSPQQQYAFAHKMGQHLPGMMVHTVLILDAFYKESRAFALELKASLEKNPDIEPRQEAALQSFIQLATTCAPRLQSESASISTSLQISTEELEKQQGPTRN